MGRVDRPSEKRSGRSGAGANVRKEMGGWEHLSALAPEVRVPQLQGQVPLLERLLYLQRDSQPLACTESSWEALSRMET